jgi:hypothetical protein
LFWILSDFAPWVGDFLNPPIEDTGPTLWIGATHMEVRKVGRIASAVIGQLTARSLLQLRFHRPAQGWLRQALSRERRRRDQRLTIPVRPSVNMGHGRARRRKSLKQHQFVTNRYVR